MILLLVPVPAPGQVSVTVDSITASSISLSWSVASGWVASSEVVWRENDRGAESASGSLTGTNYTIDQLDNSTLYTVRVRVTNVAGTTDSLPIVISTSTIILWHKFILIILPHPLFTVSSTSDNAKSCDCTRHTSTIAIIGGIVVAVVLILCITMAVIFTVLARSHNKKTGHVTRYVTANMSS